MKISTQERKTPRPTTNQKQSHDARPQRRQRGAAPSRSRSRASRVSAGAANCNSQAEAQRQGSRRGSGIRSITSSARFFRYLRGLLEPSFQEHTTIMHCRAGGRSAIQLGLVSSLLSIVAAEARGDGITMESAIEYALTATKVLLACSPILAIVAVLAFAREDEETEIAKRKIKCARS